jgi:predicted enzyme related to lactoylglutathione lyase
MTIKKFSLTVIIILAFSLGYSFKTYTSTKQDNARKATGIGGIFFKCKNPKLLREWYKTNLGINTNQYGAVFEWRQAIDSTKRGYTQWSPFGEKTTYFEPSTKDFMINYRVENLSRLVEQLKKDGVTITDEIETVEYGKFVHVLDLEGNKVELWEPNDEAYENLGKKMGSITTK